MICSSSATVPQCRSCCSELAMRQRIDLFPGTDEEYVQFLETEVIGLRNRLQIISEVESQIAVISPFQQTQTVPQRPPSTTAPTSAAIVTLPTAALGPNPVAHSAAVLQLSTPTEDPSRSQRDLSNHSASNSRIYASELRDGRDETSGGFHIWKPEEHKIKYTTISSKIDWLVRHMPKATQWLSRIQEARLFDCVQSGNIISHLLESDPDVPLTQSAAAAIGEGGSSSEHLVSRVMELAQLAAKKAVDATVSLMISRFQKFVVLSACRVLRQTRKITSTDCKTVAMLCLGKNIGDKYCRRIMNTVLFLNRLIDSLGARGWTRRAAELVLLCAFH